MDLDELTKIVFSVIKDNDPYKASKQLQLKHWCSSYVEFIDKFLSVHLPFFLDTLSDKECWEKTNTIHGIKLNRRLVAKKMIEPQSWKGTSNPLNDFNRYQVACWCCLEEDIIALFEHFKQEDNVQDGDSDALKKLVKAVSGSWYTDSMMQFWSHFVSGYISELDLKGQHPYVFGLDRAVISMPRKRVEAVEFFWNKIKSLPKSELSAQEKDKVFMKIAVHTGGDHCNSYPDVFEFCFNQISPDKYTEFLKRDLAQSCSHSSYPSLYALNYGCYFDQCQKLFDYLKPKYLSNDGYYCVLSNIKIERCSEQYINAGVDLFMHVWMKEGFDNQRAFVLEKEMISYGLQGNLLTPFVKKGCMELVWAVLDKANSSQIKEFMSSRKADYMCSILEQGDNSSLNKFLAYSKPAVKNLDEESISADLVEVDLSKIHDQSYVRLGDH